MNRADVEQAASPAAVTAVTAAGDAPVPEAEIRRVVTAHLDALPVDGGDVVVLIPDGTRTAPLRLLFDVICTALAGRTRRLRFLIALGTHQPMSDEAIGRMLGPGWDRRAGVQVHNHAWYDDATFADLGVLDSSVVRGISGGRLDRAVPVRVNRAVVDADHVVVCGPVFPHEVVGFSGGTKYLFPGVGEAALTGLSHWLGALITCPEIIGKLPTTPVRRLIDAAADLVPTPTSGLCFVTGHGSPQLAGLFTGDLREAWAAAARLSARLHVTYVDHPYRTVVAVMPEMYDEMWVAAKGMYKLEPVVADGGELIVLAPHVTRFSATHDAVLQQVGYHCRDWFLAHWSEVEDLPWGVLAHSTHLYGAGTYDPVTGAETPRIRVSLATGIPEAGCRAMNLGYRDAGSVDLAAFAAAGDDVLVVPRAGEQLYRLTATR